jgi:hypothetical protein
MPRGTEKIPGTYKKTGCIHGCVYSRSMEQVYPRICVVCLHPEPVEQKKEQRQ